MSDEVYPAGVDVPGTPVPFPVGLVSFGFAGLAVATVLVTMVVESSSWFPIQLWGFPALYWFAVAASLITGALALRRGPWRGWRSIAGIAAVLIMLTPIFPAALLMLFLAGRH